MNTTISCGQCGAPLRAEQDWCSLCYASVEASFDPLTAPLAEVVGRAEAGDPPVADPVIESLVAAPVANVRLDRPSESLMLTPLDESADGTGDESVEEVTDLDVMFSMLAAEHRQSDPTAGLADRLQDRSTRVAVMVGGTALIGGLIYLGLTILGAFV